MILKGKAIEFAQQLIKDDKVLRRQGILKDVELTEDEQIDFLQIQRSYEQDEIYRGLSRLFLRIYSDCIMTEDPVSAASNSFFLTISLEEIVKIIKENRKRDPYAIN